MHRILFRPSQPEFLVDWFKLSGIPLGRLYIPYPRTTQPELLAFCKSVHIFEEKLYMNGSKVIWFLAPVSEYRILAAQFPHARHFAYTQYLLKAASTFFSRLKPPYSFDYTDID
jgi:hypothetical protein